MGLKVRRVLYMFVVLEIIYRYEWNENEKSILFTYIVVKELLEYC